MEYRKTIIILMVAIFIFSITAVSASDMNDTAINSDDTSQIELTTSNEADNLMTSEENTTLAYTNNVESVSVGIDSEVMNADTGTYSGLTEEIGHGGNIELKHDYYTYDTGDTIDIMIDYSVIDGKGAVIDMAGSNIPAFTASASSVTIKNLTIKNTDPKYGDNGGIYFYHNGSVINCNFTNNRGYRGGAVYFGHSGTVINCNFTNNTSTRDGGAVYFSNTGTVTNCNFIGNTATNQGGAVWMDSGTVTKCNFINNHAQVDGGAIVCKQVLNVKNCLFNSNQAKGEVFEQCYGGAIRAKSTMVDNSTFINNCAEDYGGAIYTDSLTFANTPCYFIGNVAEDNQGGAIYADKITNDVVSNIVFINNQAKANDDGGAIYINKENHVTFDRCVFVNNSCGDEGGAIYLDSKSSTISLRNNIFSNNHAGDEGQAVFNKGTCGTINNNFWSKVIPGTSNDLLVEWKATIFRPNVHHIDTDPLHIELRLSKNNTDLNKVVRATLCYIKSDGSILPDGPNGNVSFIVPENINIKSQGINQNGTYIDFTSNKTGTFNITSNSYGQSVTKKITVKKSTIEVGDDASYEDLSNEIGNDGHINLTKKYYYYTEGSTIQITSNNSIIDGKGAIIDMAGSSIRAFYVRTSGVTIRNLTIKNANFNGDGGAVYFSSECQSGNVENCIFTNNKASYCGGAVSFYSNGNVTNCNFVNNTASVDGGAIRSFNGKGSVENCNFTNNNASHEGGSIWMASGTVENCNFDDNSASTLGGAVWTYSGTVTNCNFINNTAKSEGGAVYFSSTGEVTNCNLTNNSARYGGVIHIHSGNVLNCNFTDNIAYEGGAIRFFDAKGTVTNCNFVNNTAYEGGAIFIYSGNVLNCNFTNNTADYGGAVHFSIFGKGNISNCIFSGNSADNGGAILSMENNTVTVDRCIFKTSSDTTYNIIFSTGLTDPELNITVSEVIEGSNATILINTNKTYNGEVTVKIGDKNYPVTLVNGEGSCNITGLKAGTYTATVISKQTDKFQPTNKTISFTVKSKENQTLIDPELNIKVDNVTEGSNATIRITTNSTFNGEVTVKIGDKNYTVTLVNGEGSCNITGLKAGNYTATVISKQTDKFQPTNKTTNFTVKSKENPILVDPGLNINIDNITEGSNATITINTDKTYNGEVTVKIGDKNYSVTIVNGEGSCNITGLKAGNYTTTVILKQTDKFNASSKTINFTVKSKPMSTVIKSSAVTTTYATSKNIIITLTDKQGKALTGKKVNVILNGVSKTLTTNNKGQGILATGTTLVPKTYKVSFNFAGDNNYTASSGIVNLVVKKSTPKLTAKNKKYKAKTKNKKYTITLKNDKKQAIKNVKLTLKVNGKTYTAKTNNKGKAIFEIKKLTKKGKYKTTITFKTNQYYNKITTKTTITIK